MLGVILQPNNQFEIKKSKNQKSNKESNGGERFYGKKSLTLVHSLAF